MATEKQKAVAAMITENHGNISKTMRDVGYSDITASKPSNLTDSKGWKELMEDNLPTNELMKVHKEGLEASTQVVTNGQVIANPDYSVRHKYLDTAYKLKGSYAAEKKAIEVIDESLSDEELLLAEQILAKRRSQTTIVESHGSLSESMGGEVQN